MVSVGVTGKYRPVVREVYKVFVDRPSRPLPLSLPTFVHGVPDVRPRYTRGSSVLNVGGVTLL